jgi:BirA family biotin operon repressor/biotin-[acetyl-CoA-carboxylase] ligase
MPLELADPLRQAGARIAPLARRVLWYPEATSTNDLASRLAEDGAEEGTLVVADRQTAGRGRMGRQWASPPGVGIYATVVLRPAAHVVPLLTIAAGVAIAEGIAAATGLAARVKWPNDVVVDDGEATVIGRKVAGILAEGGTSPDGAAWVVLGFGINVLPGAYPPDVAARATSLERELGRPIDRGLVLAECLAALASRYGGLQAGDAAAVVAAWRTRAAATFGRRVEWDGDGRTQQGTAQDIDPAGALLVRTEDGVRRIISGEVRWI